jgi:hypothetical protein
MISAPPALELETMGKLSLGYACTHLVIVSTLLVPLAGCDHHCGLGERERTPLTGSVACCSGTFRDVQLKGETSDAEFSLANTALPTQAGSVDAFIVPTSCDKLFDGTYPGASPLCTILAGPAKPGGVSNRVKLSPGAYRVYLQAYPELTTPAGYVVDVYTWDYSCRPLIQ